MLDLPAGEWGKKRVPLAVLAECAQELPAILTKLSCASILREKLLDTAKDVRSFTIRRYSLVILGQFRTVSAKILEALASGCRDFGSDTVQKGALNAISSLQRIDANTLPQLVQMLSSPSIMTVYAAAMVMGKIGSSHQAVREYGLHDSVVNGIGQAIRGITFSRYLRDDKRTMLDDILFTTLVEVTNDYTQEVVPPEVLTFENWSASSESQEHRLQTFWQTQIAEEPTIHISFPYLEDSIEKVSYQIRDQYFDLIIIPGSHGLLFSAKQVAFTKGYPPVLDEKQMRDMEQKEGNRISKFIISIPYKEGSLDGEPSYEIANNYLHLTFRGSMISSFDMSNIRYKSSTKKTSD